MKEFENILLKKLIYSGEFFGKVMPILKPQYFTEIGHQDLLKLITEYYHQYRSLPSLVELVAKVKNVPNKEIRAEIVKSLQTINATDEPQNVEFMCEETLSWVKDAMYFESLRIGSEGLMEKNDEKKLKAQQIMDERAKITIDYDFGLDFDDLDTMIEYYSTRLTGVRTHHQIINKRLGPGFLPGTLSLILAAAGIGKSLLMTDLISGMIKDGKNVLLVSLEMADKEIMKRVHANAMDLPINSLIDLGKDEKWKSKYNLTKDDIVNAYNQMKKDNKCGKLYIKDYPSNSLSPLMLEQLVESYKVQKDIEFDVVYVDYLGIMKSDLLSPAAGLYSYIKSVGEELRAVAKKLFLPIISASQLNRGVYKQDTKEVDNSSISDSLGSSMTADWMVFLLQDEERKEKGEMVCKCTKNRFNGRTDTWTMGVDYEHMRFYELQVDDGSGATVPDLSTVTENPTPKITAESALEDENFAKQEVKDIIREDVEKIKEIEKNKKDPFNNDLEDIYKDLGID